MGRAAAKRGQQKRRAREGLDRALRRRSVTLALEALGELGEDALVPAERAALGAWLGPLLEAALADRDAAALGDWLGAIARNPRLPELLGLGQAETCWPLLWAAAAAGNWKTAELLYGQLGAVSLERAPRLASAVAEYISSRGRLDPQLALQCSPEPLSDARLGVEVVQPRSRRPSTPPPADEQAASELIELYATEPWDVFSNTAERWLRSHAGKAPLALRVSTAELAAYELSRRDSSLDHARCFPPVELVLCACGAGDPPPTQPGSDRREHARLEQALLLSLRVVLGAVAASAGARPSPLLLQSLLRAALASPQLRAPVVSAFTHIAGTESNRLPAELLRELHAAEPSPLLWARAALALDREEERRAEHDRAYRPAVAQWIEKTLQAHLARPAQLAECLGALSSKDCHRLLAVLADILEATLAGDVFLALWPEAGEGSRDALVQFAYSALEAATSASFCPECDAMHVTPLDDFADLSAQGKQLLERVAERALPRDPRFLRLLLARAPARGEQRALLEAFTADPAPIDHHVIAIGRARSLGIPQKPLRERLRSRFAGNLGALARGLELAVGELGPRSSTSRELAEQLLAAAANPAAREPSTELSRLLRLAQRLLRRRPRGAPSRQVPLPFGDWAT